MSSPFPMFGSQNVNDDDGQVIDSFLIETDAPPDLKDMIEPIPVPDAKPIIRPTRTLAGTEILTQTTTAYMLLAADPNRIALYISVYSYATTPGQKDYVLVADELSKVTNPSTQGPFRMRHNLIHDLSGSTGAVWITPGPIVADNIEVSWRAITK